MKIKLENSKFRINQEKPGFRIEQSEYLFLSGYKSGQYFSYTNNQKAKQITLDIIKRISQEGDILMRIENKQNFADIAAMSIEDFPDINIASAHKNHIDWQMGYFNMEWSKYYLNIEWQIYKPEIKVDHGKVNVYIKQSDQVDTM